MDGTLTRSRSEAEQDMIDLFKQLQYTTIVISGAEIKQINAQVKDLNIDYLMGQNGNQTYHKDKVLWENKLTDEEREEIMAHIRHIESVRDWDVANTNDLIEDRGNQISYSCLGHHEDVAKKEAFDKGGAKRTKLLEENPLPLKLTEAKIGGTTCFDYIRKNSNKGTNIARLIEEQGWNKDECVYFGDALFPGGNDETMIGVMDIQKVADEHDTLKILKDKYL